MASYFGHCESNLGRLGKVQMLDWVSETLTWSSGVGSYLDFQQDFNDYKAHVSDKYQLR